MKDLTEKKKQLQYLPYAGLTLLTLLIMIGPLERGELLGSEGDWLSQHVGAAETLRQTMLERGTIFPQHISIGGGSNSYDLAYYGMFRPDVLISCLIPDVEMKYIVSVYSVICALAAVNLCFLWLSKKGISVFCAFLGAAVMASASCFFQFHRQIMFVDYMPFLVAAFMGIDSFFKSRKTTLFSISVFLICIQSFFYAPACLAICLIYFVFCLQAEDGGAKIKISIRAAMSAAAAVGSAAVLLLPVALDILSTEKDSGSFSKEAFDVVDLSLDGLLYDTYGCGVTLIVLYALILSLKSKERRGLTSAVLICFLIPAVSFVLSGFLYARSKTLIPFLPLLILLFSLTVEDVRVKRQKPSITVAFVCLIPAFFSQWSYIIAAEAALILTWCCAEISEKIPQKYKRAITCCLLIIPVSISFAANMGENYIRTDDSRQGPISAETLTQAASDHRYRFEYLSDDLANCNLLQSGKLNRASIYSSVSNSLYNRFYYDIMRNPISIQNRVALLPDQNPLFNYFMGIRYVAGEKDMIPYGYEKIAEEDGYIIAENENVLPVCYGTSHLISESDYDKLSFPQNLKALCERAVVTDVESPEDIISTVKELDIDTLKNANFDVKKGQIIIITFDVNRGDQDEVIIELNGMKNKLSSQKAPYPNNNYTFTYILAAEEDGGGIKSILTEGDYEIENLRVYTMDMPAAQIIMPVSYSDLKKNTVFEGIIDMEESGYFVTSFPYKEGYEITVDGKNVQAEKVNCAFIGFSLGEGSHEIEITYTAPGFKAGLAISIVSISSIILTEFMRKRKGEGGER